MKTLNFELKAEVLQGLCVLANEANVLISNEETLKPSIRPVV